MPMITSVKIPSIIIKIEWSSSVIGVPAGFGEPSVIRPPIAFGMARPKTGVQQRIINVSNSIINRPRTRSLRKTKCPRPMKHAEAICALRFKSGSIVVETVFFSDVCVYSIKEPRFFQKKTAGKNIHKTA